jgi:glutamine---fructose-6-phosphate transaminase (isomerizing)
MDAPPAASSATGVQHPPPRPLDGVLVASTEQFAIDQEQESMPGPGIESFMYRTMMGQPEQIDRLMTDGWDQASRAADLLRSARRVAVTGIGTSYHAALVGSWLLRAAGFDAMAVTSFDFSVYPEHFAVGEGDAVIVMAHTGVKSYSKLALDRAVAAGATVLSVGSLSAEHPGSALILRTVERERSAAYTASHLAAMTVLAQISTLLGESNGRSTADGFRVALERLPGEIESVLQRAEEVRPVAEYAVGHRTYAAGAGPNEATALELVIKAREAAYGQVDALAAEQFLHGPMVAVNEGDLAVMVHVPGAAASRVAEITSVLDGIGARLWIVGQPVEGALGGTTFSLPGMPEPLSPLVAVVPMQMLAYQMAEIQGFDPDTFRRNDERYKAAFGRLTL